MTMLKIPAGSFVRRDTDKDVDQMVTLTRSFLLCDSEVTRAQFQQFTDDHNYLDAQSIDDHDYLDTNHEPAWEGKGDAYYSPTGQHPVREVTWYAAILYCNWLSHREGLKPCYERTGEREKFDNEEYDAWRLIPGNNGYRLPTEAEWEYACRAGTTTNYSHGDDKFLLDRYAVYYLDTHTQLPASKLPNPWGLFDVHGNVWEWCNDWHKPFDSAGAISDPFGPARSGLGRIYRGGSYVSAPLNVRSDARNWWRPNRCRLGGGMRVARTYP